MSETEYDSTHDTLVHINRVRELLGIVREDLSDRALVHDASKLQSPEKEAFDVLTPKLKGMTYGSAEYRACLRDLKPALDHHYAHNSHHPEFYEKGVDGMTLLDVVEMFCDWKAATERHADGSLERSIQQNKERFKMDPQLVSIFENTRKALGW